MLKSEKQACIDRYKAMFEKNDFAFVFRCKGLSSEDWFAVRAAIQSSGGEVKVVKNTLAKLAAVGTKSSGLSDLFKTESVVVTAEDYVGSVKSMLPFLKVHKGKVVLAGGVLNGKILDKNELEELGKIKTVDELRAEIAFLLQYPLINIAYLVDEIAKNK